MNYTADSLYYSAKQERLTAKYNDLVKRQKVDTRSGDEVAKEVIEKAGLRFEE